MPVPLSPAFSRESRAGLYSFGFILLELPLSVLLPEFIPIPFFILLLLCIWLLLFVILPFCGEPLPIILSAVGKLYTEAYVYVIRRNESARFRAYFTERAAPHGRGLDYFHTLLV